MEAVRGAGRARLRRSACSASTAPPPPQALQESFGKASCRGALGGGSRLQKEFSVCLPLSLPRPLPNSRGGGSDHFSLCLSRFLRLASGLQSHGSIPRERRSEGKGKRKKPPTHTRPVPSRPIPLRRPGKRPRSLQRHREALTEERARKGGGAVPKAAALWLRCHPPPSSALYLKHQRGEASQVAATEQGAGGAGKETRPRASLPLSLPPSWGLLKC